MEHRHLCLSQCCQGGTSVPGQEHDSFRPYRAERGDRQEQITLRSGVGERGMGDKVHEREKKKSDSNGAVTTPPQYYQSIQNCMM